MQGVQQYGNGNRPCCMIRSLAKSLRCEPNEKRPGKVSKTKQKYADKKNPKGTWKRWSLRKGCRRQRISTRRFTLFGEKEHRRRRQQSGDDSPEDDRAELDSGPDEERGHKGAGYSPEHVARPLQPVGPAIVSGRHGIREQVVPERAPKAAPDPGRAAQGYQGT